MNLIRNSRTCKICFDTSKNTWYKIESSKSKHRYDFQQLKVYCNNY